MKELVKKRASFRIIGYPVGWTAPKQGIRKGSTKRNFYQSPQLKRWQETIRAQIITKHRPILEDGPLVVVLTFFIERAQANKKKPLPIIKPDLDNLIKSTIDAMKKLVFKDDNVIVDIQASKRWCNDRYTPHGGKPGVDIAIYRVE